MVVMETFQRAIDPGTPGGLESYEGVLRQTFVQNVDPSSPERSPEFEAELQRMKQQIQHDQNVKDDAGVHAVDIENGIEDARRAPSIKMPSPPGMDMG